jgi:hypothetical protein
VCRTRGTLASVRLALALLLALAIAGCGAAAEPKAGDDAPLVTPPGSTQPYESGGADGSGGDGEDGADQRGGAGASADSDEPREGD